MKEADKEQHLVDSDKEWCHLDFLGVPSLKTDFPPYSSFPLCFITLLPVLAPLLSPQNTVELKSGTFQQKLLGDRKRQGMRHVGWPSG